MEPETLPPEKPETTSKGEPASKRPIWMRGLFMLLLMIAFGFAQGLLWILAVVQFLWLLFADEPNAFLIRFGKSLSLWFAETTQYVTCVSDVKPFPWSAWPSPH